MNPLNNIRLAGNNIACARTSNTTKGQHAVYAVYVEGEININLQRVRSLCHGHRNQIDPPQICLKTNCLETGRCKKKARPLHPQSSMLKCGFVQGGAKKKPPTVFRATAADTSTLNLGGRGLFFRTDRYPTSMPLVVVTLHTDVDSKI